MEKRKRQIQLRRTVLVIVEGETEFAFCRFLKAHLSRGRNLQVNIKPARGGSPDSVVEFARRQIKLVPHDHLAIVFDTDRPLTTAGEERIKQLKAATFRFTPCIEGFFLQLMGRSVPADSDTCKRHFHEYGLDKKAKLFHEAYEKCFPISELDRLGIHPQFEALRQLFFNDGSKESL